MTPQLISPSQLINCTDVTSCFQALYNFAFTIFLALCLFQFIYGAFQYLLSGAYIFRKEEGKKKMQNSIIALIVVLIIPLILNLINPDIFKVKFQIPSLEVKPPDIEIITDIYPDHREEPPPFYTSTLCVNKYRLYQKGPKDVCTFIPDNFLRFDWPKEKGSETSKREWMWSEVFKGVTLKNITTRGEIYLNPEMKDLIIRLDEELEKAGIKIEITSGYRHWSRDVYHVFWGTALDFVVAEGSWEQARDLVVKMGFPTLYEVGSCCIHPCTGNHIHIYVPVRGTNCP